MELRLSMLKSFETYTNALLHLFYPQYCAACNQELMETEYCICSRCSVKLPQTNFHLLNNNPVEKIFWGRVHINHATACFYFTKESLMQQIIHQVKYQGRKDVGHFMGQWMGRLLLQDKLLADISAIVPVPLHPAKEKQRGYNQAALLAEGISEVFSVKTYDAIKRLNYNETQTHKGRVARWQNVKDIFKLNSTCDLQGRHVLLIDDVVTTGATLEACASALAQIPFIKISIATLAVTND
jgi:ComF family protein